MAWTLDIIVEQYKFRIAWYEDGEEGGWLGQDPNDGLGDAPTDSDDWEHWAASGAVRALPSTQSDSLSFFWESMSDAKAALRVAKLALKSERPMPDWARTAIANGWKPPRGWKP